MKTLTLIAAAAVALGAGAATAQTLRYVDEYSYRVARGPDWNLGAAEGVCRLRLFVDDRARVEMRGDQIVIRTLSGHRSFDQGSVCNQPLPLHRVEDFRITAQRGRGAITEVVSPARRNNFTGALTIHDPQNDADTYEITIAWRNPEARSVEPLAAAEPFPYFDETRACQERVRAEFVRRNDDDAYLEFASVPLREELGPDRERIRGEAWARNRLEARPVTYECVVNERTSRVVTATYEVRPRNRYSSLY